MNYIMSYSKMFACPKPSTCMIFLTQVFGVIDLTIFTGKITWHLPSKVRKVDSLRNRFFLIVIFCPVYHWLEVSREVDISRARRASDILT